jgi:hypothetical protein
MMKFVVAGALLSIAIATGPAFAQTPPATGQSMAPAKMAPDDKKAVSKSCTDQANAKGLHGKARKKFRSECKHNAGKEK